jgi:two-component system, LytTR family, response regulator
VRLIDRLEPELAFLDICLPELSGLEVARRIRHRPEIVFTTANDCFAVAAFEVGALDYLLKPFGRQRFQAMLAAAWRGAMRPPRRAVRSAARRMTNRPRCRFMAHPGPARRR